MQSIKTVKGFDVIFFSDMSNKERQENGFENRKGDFECRMLIPSKMAGSIIGKNHSFIKIQIKNNKFCLACFL